MHKIKQACYWTLLTIAIGTACNAGNAVQAGYYRQYYSSWGYHGSQNYYYVRYYYQPAVSYSNYHYHYCMYYPSRPRYVYYYNPYRRVFWGRYDLESKGYSLLAEADRKEKLTDIPESAFPAPGKMPAVPESDAQELMSTPPSPPTEAVGTKTAGA